MTRQRLRRRCESFPGAVVDYPYGDDCVRAFKVGGKIFAFYTLTGDLWLSLKSKPSTSAALRKAYLADVEPGFFNMQKTHWNTIRCGGDISDSELTRLIDESYRLVVGRLPSRLRPISI